MLTHGNHAEEHFLGGKDFGVMVLLMNTVASFVSGFVLMEVPKQAATFGFITLFYMGACNNVGIVMNLTWPRFRRIFANRNYQGPNDMVSDRYNSVTMKLLSCGLSAFQSLVFVAIEWQVVELVIPGLLKGDLEGKAVVWFLATLVLLCEFIGGMTSVAMSDAIQMTVMGTCFLLLLFLSMLFYYGGFWGLVDYGCSNYHAAVVVLGAATPTCGGALAAVNCNAIYPVAFNNSDYGPSHFLRVKPHAAC